MQLSYQPPPDGERSQRVGQPGSASRDWVLATISNVHRALVSAATEDALYASVCEALTVDTPFALVSIAIACDDPGRTVYTIASAGRAKGYADGLSVSWGDGPYGNGPVGRAIRTGEIQFNDNLMADDRFAPWRDRAQAFGLRSSFVLPVHLPGGALAVLLSVYSERIAAVDRDQLGHFRLLGGDLGVCIEILRTRAALNAALRRAEVQDQKLFVLSRAFENSAAAVMITGPDHRISSVNAAFESLFGYHRNEILDREPSLLRSDHHGAAFFDRLHDELRTSDRWAGEIVNRHRHGHDIICWSSVTAVRDTLGELTDYIYSFRDISEQKRSMAAAAQEHAFALAMMESMPGIVYFYDRDGRFKRWNRNFLDVSGYSAEEIQAMRPLDFFAEEDKALLASRIAAVFADGNASVEAPFRTKSGRTIPYLFTGRRLTFAGEDFLIGVGIDISQRKAAEEALSDHIRRLQTLSRQVMEIQEAERQALGRELHDTVAQDIAAVGLNLTILPTLLPEPLDAAIAQRLDDSRTLLEEAARRLRNVMVELRPPGLDEFGLLAALREHARRLSQRVGLNITIVGQDPNPRCPPAVAIALFRIVQEGLNNIVKHAAARSVVISLADGRNEILLEVRDDGIGFDPAVRPDGREGGMGLITMAERAQAIGARCTVATIAGQGTTVMVRLPRPPAAKEP